MIRWKLDQVMTQGRFRNKDLADALKITPNSAYRLRRRETMPRLDEVRLHGLCKFLKCQPGDLLESIDDEPDDVPTPLS